MQLTNNEMNVQAIIGGPKAFKNLMDEAASEGWSHRKLLLVLSQRGVTISQFGVRSLLNKWKDG